MSKLKEPKEEVVESDSNRDLIKILGAGGIINADELVATSSSVISVSPSMDIGLNGGIPGGTTVVLTGKPKVGKTTLALTIMAQGQKDGRKCFYESVEGRLKEMNLNGISGLDRSKLEIISSYKDPSGKIISLTAEQYLDAAISILRNNPRCILCIDSIAALCPEAEFQLSMGEYAKMAGVPTLLYKFFRQAAQILPVNDSILILITHMISNPGAKGNQKQTNEKGGNAQAYGADIKLEAMYTELIDDGSTDTETKKILGQICHWKVICSALGPPFGKIRSHIKYGIGIDRIAELIELGTLYGFITGKGWYTLSFAANHLDELGIKEWDEDTIKQYKYQGVRKVYAALDANPQLAQLLESDLKQMLLTHTT